VLNVVRVKLMRLHQRLNLEQFGKRYADSLLLIIDLAGDPSLVRNFDSRAGINRFPL
jgi:hypothetical protein